MTQSYTNCGQGYRLAIAQSHPWTIRSSKGSGIWYRTEHPIPVISRWRFRRDENVMDSTVGFCRDVWQTNTPGGAYEFFFVYQGEFYTPGCVVEDGLVMPCIWTE